MIWNSTPTNVPIWLFFHQYLNHIDGQLDIFNFPAPIFRNSKGDIDSQQPMITFQGIDVYGWEQYSTLQHTGMTRAHHYSVNSLALNVILKM